MQKCRSSIFSFETLKLKEAFSRAGVVTFAGAFAVVIAVELVARVAFAPVGTYWEFWDRGSAEKFAWYRDQAITECPADVVIVGDSTAARDFIPDVISKECPNHRAINLGWPANFPLAFGDVTIPLLAEPYDAPKVVVVSLSPKSFVDGPVTRRFEAPIRACAFARRNRGEVVLADYLYLARFGSSKRFSSHWFGRKRMPGAPKDSGAMLLDGHESEDSIRPNRDDHEGVLSDVRLNQMRLLASLSEQRSFQLVMVIPARNYADRSELELKYIKFLESIQHSGMKIIDRRELPELKDEHFYDPGHLNRSGAERYSRLIGDQICRFAGEISPAPN